MPLKPSEAEEEYFKKQEFDRLRKAREVEAKRLDEEQRREARELHYMKSPKCGMGLQEITFRGIALDKCFSCGGIWVDDGEMAHLTAPEAAGFISSLRRLFS